jgi:hypothetical protein
MSTNVAASKIIKLFIVGFNEVLLMQHAYSTTF